MGSYHRFECDQLPVLRKCGDQAHLALRMLYNVIGGLEQIKEVADKYETEAIPLEDFNDSHDYALIYNMRQPEKRDYEAELKNTLTACFLAKLAGLSGFVQVQLALILWIFEFLIALTMTGLIY